ncbi:GTP-binding protein [Kutzneria sp. 744]|nr:GTP-binding protein [Kutzneria sp. 744]
MPTATASQIRTDLRNVAIIAHVDHGKTTLVDAMLRQSGAFSARAELVDRVMDSGELEREKGITILAKNTAVRRATPDGVITINVVDTPGHADFGGEVERALAMVDGVLLLVDASEGPLPQTRFVLRKTLAAGLPVVLVVNKVDRPDARIAEVVDETHDLLLDLAAEVGADDSVLDVPVIYASARAGKASLTQPADGGLPDGENLDSLFEVLLNHVPAPTGDPEAPLRALVTNLDASSFLGRIALCRIHAGTMRKGEFVAWCREDGSTQRVKITELLITEGLERQPADEASAGDLVAIAGIQEITIGDTLADAESPEPLPRITVDEPAISMTIGVNTSPLAGRNGGTKLTARLVKARLDSELVGNVSVRVLPTERPDTWGGAGPWRAGAGHPGRADAPRGLRADRRQAAGRHPHHRRRAVRALRAPHRGRPRGAPGRGHAAAGQPQGPHGAHGRPRHRSHQAGVRGAGAWPDRFPHRLPHRDPRHRHRQPRLRGLPPVGRRDPHPPLGLVGGRPRRHGHGVRHDPAGRPRHLLRGARRRLVRGHGRG